MLKHYFFLTGIIFLLFSACSERISQNRISYLDNQLSWSIPSTLDESHSDKKRILGLSKPHIFVKDGNIYASWIIGNETIIACQDGKTERWHKTSVPGTKQNRIMWWNYSLLSLPPEQLLLLQADDREIIFLKSTDSGKTWLNPVSFNRGSQNFLYYRNPSLAADDKGILYAIYEGKEQIGGKSMLYSAISSDGGLTWSSQPLNGIPYNNPSCYPVLLFSKNKLYCLYADILYISKDTGKTWKPLKSLKRKKSDFGNPTSIVKVSENGELFILWAEATVEKDTTNAFSGGSVEGSIDIICSKSLNGGRTWADTHPVNDTHLPFVFHLGKPTERTMDVLSKPNNMATVMDMAVSPDGNTLAAIWKDFRENSENIYFSYSQDKGKTWAKNKIVPVPQGNKPLRIAADFYDSGKIYILGSSFGSDPKGRAFHYSGGKIYIIEGNILQ
jgi:hypothetical protein